MPKPFAPFHPGPIPLPRPINAAPGLSARPQGYPPGHPLDDGHDKAKTKANETKCLHSHPRTDMSLFGNKVLRIQKRDFVNVIVEKYKQY